MREDCKNKKRWLMPAVVLLILAIAVTGGILIKSSLREREEAGEEKGGTVTAEDSGKKEDSPGKGEQESNPKTETGTQKEQNQGEKPDPEKKPGGEGASRGAEQTGSGNSSNQKPTGGNDSENTRKPGGEPEPGENTPGEGEKPGENTPGEGEKPGENTPGEGEKPGENTPGEEDLLEIPKTGEQLDPYMTVSKAQQSGSQVVISFTNRSTLWEASEASYLTYTCYDREGKVLRTGREVFGFVEPGGTGSCTLDFPEGTARVEVTEFVPEYYSVVVR